MYYVSNLQPKRELIHDGYRDMFLSRREQEQQIMAFYKSKKKIPLCLDHGADDSDCNTVLTKPEILGEVLDLFINREGMMMVKFKLDNSHPFYKEINQSLHINNEGWGVSIWVQHMEGQRTGKITKEVGHVALTKDPLFGKLGTMFHGYGVHESGVDKEIGKNFYQEGVGESFASKELKAKIQGGMRGLPSVIRTMSDDQPQNTVPEGGGNEPERNIKTEPSATTAVVVPLSQQPSPPKDEGTYLWIANKIKEHDENMLTNGILLSSLPKPQRDEYNSWIDQRDAQIEAVYQLTKVMKEEEPDFKNQDPEQWKRDFSQMDGEEATRAIAYCAASSKLHVRNMEQNRILKRRVEELENGQKASSAPSPSSNAIKTEEKTHTTGQAVSSFTASPSQPSLPSQPTPQVKQGGNVLQNPIFEKMSHKEDIYDNPNRPENQVGARFTNAMQWFGKPMTTNK